MLMLLMALLAAEPQVIVVRDNDAVTKAIAANKGSVTIVKFWATWCDPCIEEFPHFLEVLKTFPEAKVVSVNVDLHQAITSQVVPFLKTHNVTFETLLLDVDDPEVVMKRINKKWKGSLPATFVYGRDGKLQKSFIGPAKTLKESVARALES
jgi:thiol-disulfide isomerase/thioredoxin